MCGIVGCWNRDGRAVDPAVTEKMLKSLEHRGPDYQGVWAGDAVTFGHCRLSILDVSERGHQPYMTADEVGVLTYNGEIYNFRELRRDLESEGVCFVSGTDAEVVLQALHLWSPEKAIPRFDGMFALAYFDKRSETLWLARDRAGIKPLYMVETNGTIAFASEMKSLFQHPLISCQPDKHALTTHLMYGRLDGNWTPFEGVRAVLPGRLIEVREGDVQESTFFDVVRDLEPERICQSSKTKVDDLVAECERLIEKSVASHLVSDVPVATTCSGGIDSSLLTMLTARLKPDLTAYVIDVQDYNQESEADQAQLVCDKAGVALQRVPVDREKFLRLWPLSVKHNDQPNYFAQNILAMALMQQVSADGFKVILTGEGADELFGGYRWQTKEFNHWRTHRRRGRIIPDNRFFREVWRFFRRFQPLDFEALEETPWPLQLPWLQGSQNSRIFCALDGGLRYVRQLELWRKLSVVKPVEERAFLVHAFHDFYIHLVTSLLSGEKMAMANAVEMRFPFLSNELIDFGLHLSCNAKYSCRTNKYLLRRVAEKHLPKEIIKAPKIGFGVASNFWKGTDKLLKNGMAADIFKWDGREMGLLGDYITSSPALVFHLVSMELWARMFFDNASPDDLAKELLAV